MTGFVGVFTQADVTCNSELVTQMTDLTARQCPDGSLTWSGAGAAFGTAVLSVIKDERVERQPATIGGDIHIVGDVRLDRRAEVIAALAQNGATSDDTDVTLVLRAYHRWGEKCIDHISGDFAFAVWDNQRRQLFCARDHYGVVPLYYAETSDGLIISTHIQCILAHPSVSDELNQTALGDFLIFSMNLDRATTVYAAIQKLSPAHTMTWDGRDLSTKTYWQHETDVDPLRYARKDNYVDEFRELLQHSVADRLRTDRAATHLSGGLDSTSIAALAKRLGVTDLQAYNITYRELLQEDEGRLAQVVADHIYIPMEVLFAEDFIGAEPSSDAAHVYPEPHAIPSQVAEIEISRRVSLDSRVLLAGFGGDPALFPPEAAFGTLLTAGRVPSAINGLVSIYRATGRLPRPGLRTWWRRQTGTDAVAKAAELPDWIDSDFAKNTDLQERLTIALQTPPSQARAGMATEPLWSNIFAWSHPGFSGQSLKTRFPFFDLRLVSFLERVPPVPWLHDKILLRDAMRGLLPEQVRTRKKSPLPGSGHFNQIQRQGMPSWASSLLDSQSLDGLVDRQSLLARLSDHKALVPLAYRQTTPVLHLSYWLNQRSRPGTVG